MKLNKLIVKNCSLSFYFILGQEQLTQVDPMFPFRLFWKQGEDSVAGLVHVRLESNISCMMGVLKPNFIV